jgi:ABC-2 type transport system ATP-binding protein
MGFPVRAPKYTSESPWLGASMIKIINLRKTYDTVVAVENISLEVEAGEVYGLLGPNGAGKTTTVKIVSGLLKQTSGTVEIAGHDLSREPKKAKAAMGVVPQELALYPELSARDNLKFWGGFYGLSSSSLSTRVDGMLDAVGLAARAKEPVKKFSGGMMRRLNLACGLVHGPKVLLLDEPTVGIDLHTRLRLLDVVKEEAKRGAAVLFTTHIMEEAEDLCQRVGIMDAGNIIAEGTVDELKAMLGEKDLLILQGEMGEDVPASGTEPVPDCEVLSSGGEKVILAASRGAEKLPGVIKHFEAAGCRIREVALKEPGLETLFIKLTGRALRD